MKVFLVLCLVASAFAYPQYRQFDFYPNPQPLEPKPCSACRANQEFLRQAGPPIFQGSEQPAIRFDRSIVIKEAAPVLVDESAPVFVNAPSPRPGRGIFEEESIPVLMKTEESEGIEEPTEQDPAGPAMIIQETAGPVAERVVMLREEGLRRESRSPDNISVPVLTVSSFDDNLVPMLTDFPSQDFARHARSADKPTSARVARSMPEMIPILTNIPAENINNEMIESILRSARSLQSTDVAAPAVAEQQPAPVTTKEEPVADKAPRTFGMYYVRVKSYNLLDDELPVALKEDNSVTTNKPCTKEQEELQKKYFEQQEKEFVDFMQQLMVEQFTSMLEQQLVQQQDQLKKFLNKQIEDEVKTPSASATSPPVTPVTGNIAESKVPESSSAIPEKIEAVESAVIPEKGEVGEAPSIEKV